LALARGLNERAILYLWISTTASVLISVANALQEQDRDRASIADRSRYGRASLLACVENLDSDLVCARGFHLDIFELERLACTPAYGSLALDNFPFSFFRHDSSGREAVEPLAQPLVLLFASPSRNQIKIKSR